MGKSSGQAGIDKIMLSYLRFQTPKENKGNIIAFFLIFLYVIGMIPIIAVPFSATYFKLSIVPVIILQSWALIYIIAPYKFEKSYYLFFGVYGVVNTYVYFLVIQKLLYLHLGVEGKGPFVIGFLLFIGLLATMNWLNIKALYTGTYHKMQQMESINVRWLSFAGLGYVIGQLILMFVYSESAKMMFFIFLISLLSIVTAYFSVYLHRYFYIVKNKDLVKQVYPDFGLPLNERQDESKKSKRKK
ncbi:hypothetical protein FQ087_13195 [Sporosarcina sp. ANT_H38]|uniref:hypothetical protein n=1 Tax=Sporosarcina sp. ANT_H38 TaxID=2597358 RepID=UPI0011F0DD3E|nr:hypothetical protein [Sporosarcina sp. ANT_H38]KAA0955559.1 hypothetical protein FQ087_13195 [Sporosarcina sp. ANT_H38]